MIRRFLLWLSLAVTAMAQVSLAPPPRLQFLDNNGKPLAGGKIFTFLSGTNSLSPSFTDSTGLVQNSNPVVLDSGGFGSIWLTTGQLYRVTVQNANGVQQYLVDSVVGIGSATGGGGGGGGGGTGAPVGITYVVTSDYWSQASSTSLTAGSPGTVVLSPCPAGVDYTSGAGYQVYLSGDGFNEVVAVTAGATGSGNCSVTFTPFFSHSVYTISSASAGIQEKINVACGVSPQFNFNSQCNVTIPANGPSLNGTSWSLNSYNIYGTIFWHTSQSGLTGLGATLYCHGRGPCLQVGDQISGTHYVSNTLLGLSFRSPDNNSGSLAYSGCAITQTQATGTLATITTASSCGFRPGDLVNLQFTDDSGYWGDAIVASVSGSTFTFNKHYLSTKAAQSTPGVVALSYEAILDNSNGTHFSDVNYENGGEVGHFNHFFDFWDDESALIEHFNNNGIPLTQNANWTGSFIYSGGNPIGPSANPTQQWASVITLRDSSITANFSNGITVDNSNGLYVENTVIQAVGPWQVKSSTWRGNYQGAYLKNIYSEGSAGFNPITPARSPFAGTGTAGLIAGVTAANGNYTIAGNGQMSGAFPSGGSGSTPYSYFIVVNDWTGASCGAGTNTPTSPMQVMNWLSNGIDNIPVLWPRVANGTDSICYDMLRTLTPVGVGAIYPNMTTGSCPGGTTTTCGYVAIGLTQAVACSGALTCSFSDTHSTVTCGTETCAYTVAQGTYAGPLNFWPGTLVTVSKSVGVDSEQGNVVGVGLSGNPLQVMTRCTGYGAASSGGYTDCLGSVTSPNNSVPNQTATILTDGGTGGGGMSLSKGRLNFSTTAAASLQPHHIITLVDSQPALTRATSVYRPPASANDVWIGTDVPAAGVALNLGRLAFGAPVSISHYIAHTGDGVVANWGEQLTANLKEFQVLTLFDLGFNVSGALLGQQLAHNGTKFVAGYPGVVVDTESAASVTVQGDASVTPFSNRGTLLNLTNNTTSTAVTLPATGSAGFGSNFVFAVCNSGTIVATITSASNINGNGTLVLPAKPSGGNPSCAFVWSTNSTWIASLTQGTAAVVIASGTATMPTTLLTTNTCATAVTTSSTGVLSTDSVEWAYNAAPSSPNGLLTITHYVATNTVGFVQCNPTSASQTPTAATINWKVIR